jgi:hypothetical protein
VPNVCPLPGYLRLRAFGVVQPPMKLSVATRFSTMTVRQNLC